MEKAGGLTKGLTVLGTVLAWVPVVAGLLAPWLRFGGGSLDVYWYVPAALFPFAVLGGGLLIWAAARVRWRRGAIIAGLAVATAAWVAASAVAMTSGLASGATQPGGAASATVVALFVISTLAVVWIGMAGVMLARHAFVQGRGDTDRAASAG